MTLTFGNGPLAPGAPTSVNYQLDGPRHKLLLSPFPRRVRAVFAGKTLLDTQRATLLHESNIAPALYVPIEDIDSDLLQRTELSTHCPFKGDASYWSIVVDGRTSENSVWGYESPIEGAAWLEGYVAMYWDHLDQWFDEDEEVFGHLRDPYHRVDVRSTSRNIRVSIGGLVVAESSQTVVLSETGMPNRYYIPESDITTGLFSKSETSTHCAYKGASEYWTFNGAPSAEAGTGQPQAEPDVAWSYPSPFDGIAKASGHWSFDGDNVTVEID